MTAKSDSYNLFATGEDIREVLHRVEASYPLQYVMCGLFDEPEQLIFQGFSSLPALGLASTGESIREPTFLVMFQGGKLKVRTVPQRRGGVKYAVDQQCNPGTVAIRPGGLYNGSVLIAGMVGTTHKDDDAAILMKAFSSVLQQNFTKMKSYLVGPQAKILHASGMRLTHSVFAPADLNLSA